MRAGLAAAAAAAFVLASPAAAEADLSGFWAPQFGEIEPDPAMLAKLPPDTVVIEDTFAPEFPRMVFGGLELTPEALAHAEAWQPEDEMTLQKVCSPPSIVYSVQGPFPFQIDQTGELIAFRYEYYDQIRLIFLDGRDHPPAEAPHTKMGHSIGRWEGDELVVDTTHIAASTITNNGLDHSDQIRLIFLDGREHPPADAPHTKMGHSIGRWEGDELVVDTTHIAASTITNNGLDHSDQIHMVERYRLSPDGTKLLATQWFEDAAVLQNNGARVIEWEKRPGQYVLPYECDPTFALEYQERGAAED